MKNSKNKRTVILSVILLGLLMLAYKVIFMSSNDTLVEENIAATETVMAISQQVEAINFDTSVIKNQALKSLKSIEAPLIQLPVGKRNPFSPSGSN
jgi:hypothetical protein